MRRRIAVLALTALLAPPTARAAFTVTVVPAAAWGAPDAELGLADSVVEDFEDLDLAPGLGVELSASGGAFTGAVLTALPATFAPVGDDPYGDAFVPGVWDGTRVLLSTEGNVAVPYGATDFRRIQLHVPDGTPWLGFALQQLTGNEGLYVNGQPLGRVAGLGLTPTPDRNGYVVVRSDDPADPVRAVAFGGGGDGFVVDHVAFAPAGQVPAAATAWSAVRALYR